MSSVETIAKPGEPPHVHHMDAPTAYQSAKFAMWLFLGTEVLLFGGLFAAFFIYRWMYLEEFIAACRALNPWMGATNTAVLLFSSFTAALAVDAAQRGDNAKVRRNLVVTIVCGFVFLLVKYFEYSGKVSHGIFPGDFHQVLFFGAALLLFSFAMAVAFSGLYFKEFKTYWTWIAISVALFFGYFLLNAFFFAGPPEALVAHAGEHVYSWNSPEFSQKYKMFYGLYYCMTGLHVLHVILGMALLFWVYIIGKRDSYSEKYYTPVEVGALYWHLVDLIWIYLFPLLYLVGQ